MDRERTDHLGRRICEMQAPEFRELQNATCEEQILTTQRMVRQLVALGEVTIDSLEAKARELWDTRPVRAYLSRIAQAAVEMPEEPNVLATGGSTARLYVPLHDARACQQIAAENQCECQGGGLVSRRVPHQRYRRGHFMSYACRCPIGEAMIKRCDYQSVRLWEGKYDRQRTLFGV